MQNVRPLCGSGTNVCFSPKKTAICNANSDVRHGPTAGISIGLCSSADILLIYAANPGGEYEPVRN